MKEYFDWMKSLPEKKYFPLSLISQKISNLLVMRDVINSHPSDLEKSYREAIERVDSKDYGLPLLEYITLEIRAFYGAAYELLGKKTPHPKYLEEVKDFRDSFVGHFNGKNNREIVEGYERINDVGFSAIFEDWVEFKDKVYKILDENEK